MDDRVLAVFHGASGSLYQPQFQSNASRHDFMAAEVACGGHSLELLPGVRRSQETMPEDEASQQRVPRRLPVPAAGDVDAELKQLILCVFGQMIGERRACSVSKAC